ncbi:GTPase IMAP family member 4-like [Littorina saxatilis]|uniref:AIG1-type G domain-containing protein n=1 Tax=Littorina saxatilis TaxID=31220 RepID=A0AAN9BKY9_9CAEN
MAEEDPAVRVLVVGKTGCGKSSLSNSLLDTNVFDVAGGMASQTVKCKWHYGRRSGTFFEVVDTPGLCDTDAPEHVIFRELGKSVAMAAPGPHVLLLVLRCDRRFTKEEFEAYTKLKELFSPEMTNFLIVVFNGLDGLSGRTMEEKKKKLHEEVKKMPGNLQQVIADANNRYVGMSNTAPKRERDSLIQELSITMLDTVRRNGNNYYSTRLIWDINSYAEGLTQHYQQRLHLARREAERKAKQAILDDEKEAEETIQRIALRSKELGETEVMYLCYMM